MGGFALFSYMAILKYQMPSLAFSIDFYSQGNSRGGICLFLIYGYTKISYWFYSYIVSSAYADICLSQSRIPCLNICKMCLLIWLLTMSNIVVYYLLIFKNKMVKWAKFLRIIMGSNVITISYKKLSRNILN